MLSDKPGRCACLGLFARGLQLHGSAITPASKSTKQTTTDPSWTQWTRQMKQNMQLAHIQENKKTTRQEPEQTQQNMKYNHKTTLGITQITTKPSLGEAGATGPRARRDRRKMRFGQYFSIVSLLAKKVRPLKFCDPQAFSCTPLGGPMLPCTDIDLDHGVLAYGASDNVVGLS